MNIRDYHPSDYDGILEITKHIWDGNDYLPQMINKYFDDPNSTPRVVENNGKIVGVANTRLISKDVAWLEAIRTHLDYRGKGVATKLTKDQINNSKAMGAKYSWLFTSAANEATRKMCSNLSFEEEAVFFLWGFSRDLPEYQDNVVVADTLGLDSKGQLANWSYLKQHIDEEAKGLQGKITLIDSFEQTKQISNTIYESGNFFHLLGEFEVLTIDEIIVNELIKQEQLFYIENIPSLIYVKTGKESDEELYIGITTIDPMVLEATLAFAIENFPGKKYRLFYSNKINHKLFDVEEWQFRLMSLKLNL